MRTEKEINVNIDAWEARKRIVEQTLDVLYLELLEAKGALHVK